MKRWHGHGHGITPLKWRTPVPDCQAAILGEILLARVISTSPSGFWAVHDVKHVVCDGDDDVVFVWVLARGLAEADDDV